MELYGTEEEDTQYKLIRSIIVGLVLRMGFVDKTKKIKKIQPALFLERLHVGQLYEQAAR